MNITKTFCSLNSFFFSSLLCIYFKPCIALEHFFDQIFVVAMNKYQAHHHRTKKKELVCRKREKEREKPIRCIFFFFLVLVAIRITKLHTQKFSLGKLLFFSSSGYAVQIYIKRGEIVWVTFLCHSNKSHLLSFCRTQKHYVI